MPPTQKQTLIPLAKTVAARFKLDPLLVCGVVEQESAWNPWAMRYEPMFMTKYVAPLYTANKISGSEAYARSFSWGLMQIMGQTARELGYDALYLSGLCDPEAGLSLGCEKLFRCAEAEKGDVQKTLLRWNGGANPQYPVQVMARMKLYA